MPEGRFADTLPCRTENPDSVHNGMGWHKPNVSLATKTGRCRREQHPLNWLRHYFDRDKEAVDVSDTQNSEYEEISSDEVDNVVAALEQLGETVTSDTIKALIEECSNSIYYLVYEDEEGALGEAA